jgi:hypothetical protein
MRQLNEHISRRHISWYRWFGVALGIAIATVLGACGSTSMPVAGGTTIPGQDCGRVRAMGDSVTDPHAAAVETCLYQHYQHCQAATLTLTQAGVDTSETHILRVTGAPGHCALADTVQYAGLGHVGTPGPGEHDTCQSLRQTAAGLSVSGCDNEDDFTIPAPRATTP